MVISMFRRLIEAEEPQFQQILFLILSTRTLTSSFFHPLHFLIRMGVWSIEFKRQRIWYHLFQMYVLVIIFRILSIFRFPCASLSRLRTTASQQRSIRLEESKWKSHRFRPTPVRKAVPLFITRLKKRKHRQSVPLHQRFKEFFLTYVRTEIH